jgi:hypothetical protein
VTPEEFKEMRQILWQFVPIENYGEALAELEKIARRTVSGQEARWRDAYEAEHKRVQRLEAILLRELGYDKAREAIAAPTPERADAEKDAARWNMHIRIMREEASDKSVAEYVSIVDAAILAANGEKKE